RGLNDDATTNGNSDPSHTSPRGLRHVGAVLALRMPSAPVRRRRRRMTVAPRDLVHVVDERTAAHGRRDPHRPAPAQRATRAGAAPGARARPAATGPAAREA